MTAEGDKKSGLSVSGLSYAHGEKIALDDVSFNVAGGAFCALLGPNGAGKSTLFSLITRLFIAPSGDISVAGVNLRDHPGDALARIGLVFQQPTLDLDLTVVRNLRYFAALQGIWGSDADRRIASALDRLDMAERARERARDLNGGHRRRMEIARALIHEPAVLLLDEPTVGLDAASRQSITDHVHERCVSKGTSVLWATHLVDEVRDNDHLIVLHKGRVKADGRAGDIAGDTPLLDRFLALTGEGGVP